jgi:hypothetical protein
MEPTETDSVVLHASKRWWNKVDLRRDDTPWMTFLSRGKGFSLNGKDYTVTWRRGVAPFELSHAGESILLVKSRAGLFSTYEFDYAGKQWAMKQTGAFSFGTNCGADLECAGRIVGEFKTPGGFYLGTKLDTRLPRELPDEIQVFLIWIYLNTFGAESSSA